MTDRCWGGKKHNWRKTGAVYSKERGLVPTKRVCQRCGTEEAIDTTPRNENGGRVRGRRYE